MKMHLNEGEAYIEGRSAAKASELLEKAEAAGLRGSVRTTSFGYIVPASIVDGGAAQTEEATELVGDADEFDPADHSVAEVEDYLETVDDDERQRVLDAEREGKKRKSLLSSTTEEEK